MRSFSRKSVLIALMLGFCPGFVFSSVLALGEQRLLIELSRCRVDISTSESSPPGLHVLRTDGSEVPIESTGISIKNNVVKLRRGDQQNVDPDLVYTFTVLPSQDYQVDGEDLELTVTGPDVADDSIVTGGEGDPVETDDDGCTISRTLTLAGGTAHVIGGGCARVVSTLTDVTLERTSQTLDIQASGGSVAVHDHLGKIAFEGQSEVVAVLLGHRGPLDTDLSQSRLTIVDGTGSVTCRALDHSVLEVTDHQGPLNFSGSSSAATIQGESETNLALTGTDLRSHLSGGQGRIRATLEGGDLTIEEWTGRLDLQSSLGTVLTIESLDGDFALNVNEAQGEITGISGHTRGNLVNSELDFLDLKSIEIVTDSSQISVENVRSITQMAISGGNLEYEAFGVEGNPNISLLAEASATIMIPQPCVIRCTGPGSKDLGRVSVSGCEFRAPDQPWGRRPRQAQPTIQLQIEMQEDTDVHVSGY